MSDKNKTEIKTEINLDEKDEIKSEKELEEKPEAKEEVKSEPTLKAFEGKPIVSDDPRLNKNEKVKTPEELERERELERIKLEKLAEKRKVYIEKRLKALEREVEKERKKLKKSTEAQIAKTKDPSEKKDVEYYAKKKREEIEREYNSRKKVIESSSGSRLSYERKKSLYGYGFIALWLVGIIYMFIAPIVTSIRYSLNDTTIVNANQIEEYGMKAPGIHLKWNDFEWFKYAFLSDPDYVPRLGESLALIAQQVPLILIMSLFIAILINQKFRGRAAMRAIFFLPVLIATGPVLAVINGDIMSQGASGGAAQFSTLFKTDLVDGFMRFLGLYNISESFTTFVSEATSNIFNLLWKSGIQILIFLAALQQIPVSAKEAASMEGATGWEFFWKITFPTISPMILANLIYTIIDAFSDARNPIMRMVMVQVNAPNYGYSSAIAWIYFAIIGLALAIIVAIVSKFIFYQVD